MFKDYKIAYMLKNVKVKEKQKFSFLRQSVAYILSQSACKIPHAAGNVEYDVTPLVEYTKASEEELKNSSEHMTDDIILKRAVRKNLNAFFIKAIAHSLYHTPVLNGFLDYTPYRNGGVHYVAEDINLSFTVNTKCGVIKPIIRNPHLKSIETVASEMRELSKRARKTDPEELYIRTAKEYLKIAIKELDFKGLGALWILLRSLTWQRYKLNPELKDVPEDQKLHPNDILGSTCTVANIGMYINGHQTVTVIIPPEAMMFGIGNLHVKPRVVDGEIVARSVITVCATFDHRAFDAGEAFPFGKHMERYINEPAFIFEWKPGDAI